MPPANRRSMMVETSQDCSRADAVS